MLVFNFNTTMVPNILGIINAFLFVLIVVDLKILNLCLT